MTEAQTFIPSMARLEDAIQYNTSVERTEILEVSCNKNSYRSLNDNGSQLTFNYQGESMYRLSSPNTGFRVKYQFRTRDAANPARVANITLASNFLGICLIELF